MGKPAPGNHAAAGDAPQAAAEREPQEQATQPGGPGGWLAGLAGYFSRRRQARGGLYLPLVRVDRGE